MRVQKGQSGQSLTETVLLLPLFLTMVFGLIQVGHLGVGVAIVNYAASSIARLIVQENAYNSSLAQQKFDQLLIAGLKPSGSIQQTVESSITPNVTVTACAELPAYPFVGPFLKKAFGAGNSDSGCQRDGNLISLTGSGPYHFIIRGQSTARMNYNPKG